MARGAKSVGARELKTRLGGYLRAVRAGVTILVTERGEPVAELRPLPRESRRLEAALAELELLGVLTRGSGEPLAPFEPLEHGGRAVSEAIEQDREDRVR